MRLLESCERRPYGGACSVFLKEVFGNVSSGSRNRFILIAALLVTLLGVTGCGSQSGTASKSASSETSSTQATNSQGVPLYTPKYAPNGHEVAVFTTSEGTITVQLFGTDAPISVGNFVELTRKGFYDNTKFHRYVPGFVVQGGDPQTQDLSSDEVSASVANNGPVPLGTGNPGYVIKGEFDMSVNPNKHLVGSLGMARSNDPDSAGSQFYFCLSEIPSLDGSYTIFGKITEGLDVMKKLRVGSVIEKVEIKGTTE